MSHTAIESTPPAPPPLSFLHHVSADFRVRTYIRTHQANTKYKSTSYPKPLPDSLHQTLRHTYHSLNEDMAGESSKIKLSTRNTAKGKQRSDSTEARAGQDPGDEPTASSSKTQKISATPSTPRSRKQHDPGCTNNKKKGTQNRIASDQATTGSSGHDFPSDEGDIDDQTEASAQSQVADAGSVTEERGDSKRNCSFCGYGCVVS
ncbi:hypothetical protein BDV95DRAFT_664962 [Massariosphaeria phaeospora]|uniref:Uncharacterized protein n=1 Tax=Massariosphaeria phaeospora TaxID=100035 RepID=A0A7C8MK94_9PLEO|nr:hypothetical protein BDV95DRAFT_664962 [Massariosphaeria phaeospora]